MRERERVNRTREAGNLDDNPGEVAHDRGLNLEVIGNVSPKLPARRCIASLGLVKCFEHLLFRRRIQDIAGSERFRFRIGR